MASPTPSNAAFRSILRRGSIEALAKGRSAGCCTEGDSEWRAAEPLPVVGRSFCGPSFRHAF